MRAKVQRQDVLWNGPGACTKTGSSGSLTPTIQGVELGLNLVPTWGVSMQNVPSSNTRPNWLAFKVHQADDNARLYAEATKNMPLGLSIWRLENPADVRTFRLVLSNPAAGGAAGVPMEKFRGKTMVEAFPAKKPAGAYSSTDWISPSSLAFPEKTTS